MRVYWYGLPPELRAALGIPLDETKPTSIIGMHHQDELRAALETDGITLSLAQEDDDDGSDASPENFTALIVVVDGKGTLQATITDEMAFSLATAISCFMAADQPASTDDDASGDGVGDIHLAEVVHSQGAV